MKSTRMLLAGTALATVAAAVLAASALAGPAAQARTAARGLPHAQHVAFAISGSGMAELISPSRGNLAIAAGVPVQVTVTNYSREYHTFTVPGLQVSALVLPRTGSRPRTTTFTFTASRTGVFQWHCVFCAEGVAGPAHMMGGTVYVVIDPSVLP